MVFKFSFTIEAFSFHHLTSSFQQSSGFSDQGLVPKAHMLVEECDSIAKDHVPPSIPAVLDIRGPCKDIVEESEAGCHPGPHPHGAPCS